MLSAHLLGLLVVHPPDVFSHYHYTATVMSVECCMTVDVMCDKDELAVKRNIYRDDCFQQQNGLTQLVLPRMRCEPAVHQIYSLLRLFLHLGAPIISAVSLALFRSVAGCELDSSTVVAAVRQNTGSGARTGFW